MLSRHVSHSKLYHVILTLSILKCHRPHLNYSVTRNYLPKGLGILTPFASDVATIFEVAIDRNMNRRFMLSHNTVPGPVNLKNALTISFISKILAFFPENR